MEANERQLALLNEQLAKLTEENAELIRQRDSGTVSTSATPLMILGNGPTAGFGKDLAQRQSIPTWGVNYDKECDLLWQMHHHTFLTARRQSPTGETSKDGKVKKLSWMEWIKDKPPELPIMMQSEYPYIRNSLAYPWKKVEDCFDLHPIYSANTISYMLAFAIYQNKWNPIHMYGVDYYYECREDSVCERPCTEFWMGIARSRGITVGIPKGSRLTTITEPLRVAYGYNYVPGISLAEITDRYEPTYEIIENLQKEIQALTARLPEPETPPEANDEAKDGIQEAPPGD